MAVEDDFRGCLALEREDQERGGLSLKIARQAEVGSVEHVGRK